MATTLRDVALAAGVSTSAVSRAFTKGAPVSAGTRERVLKAAARLGYSPNRLAAALSNGRTGLVALIVDDAGHPLIAALVDHLTRALAACDLQPLLFNQADLATPAEALKIARDYSVQAVLIASLTLHENFARALHRTGLPVVHALGRAKAESEVGLAGINDTLAGRQAAQLLFERGYRNVAFIGGPERGAPTLSRYQGFRTAAEKLGLTQRPVFAPAMTFAQGQAATEALLATDRPDAICAGDDLLALGSLAALRAAGLTAPADIGLLAIGDAFPAASAAIGLTTLTLPLAAIAEAAVAATALAITTPGAAVTITTLPCTITDRGSLRPPPG